MSVPCMALASRGIGSLPVFRRDHRTQHLDPPQTKQAVGQPEAIPGKRADQNRGQASARVLEPTAKPSAITKRSDLTEVMDVSPWVRAEGS